MNLAHATKIVNAALRTIAVSDLPPGTSLHVITKKRIRGVQAHVVVLIRSIAVLASRVVSDHKKTYSVEIVAQQREMIFSVEEIRKSSGLALRDKISRRLQEPATPENDNLSISFTTKGPLKSFSAGWKDTTVATTPDLPVNHMIILT